MVDLAVYGVAAADPAADTADKFIIEGISFGGNGFSGDCFFAAFAH